MNHSQTITVRSEVDVVIARMKVREMARELGMPLADQARISLATSSLAGALEMGKARHGQITMDCLRNGDRMGVRVICVKKEGAAYTPGNLGDTRWMVDELIIETLPSLDMQVTLIKWLS